MSLEPSPPHPRPSGYPATGLVVPFPFVSFILTFVSDWIYWKTSDLMWQNFSSWLLFAGLLVGALAIPAALIDALRPSTRWRRALWPAALSYFCVLALGIANSLVHSADGWTAVVPGGLVLSAVTVVVIFVTIALTARLTATFTWRAR